MVFEIGSIFAGWTGNSVKRLNCGMGIKRQRGPTPCALTPRKARKGPFYKAFAGSVPKNDCSFQISSVRRRRAARGRGASAALVVHDGGIYAIIYLLFR